LRAVETAGDGLPGQRARLENGESKDVERFVSVELRIAQVEKRLDQAKSAGAIDGGMGAPDRMSMTSLGRLADTYGCNVSV
jgi:hypothetical protein